MRVILLGYNGLLGSHIFNELVQYLKKNQKINIVCVGRNIRKQQFKNKNIKYVTWNFKNFAKSKLFFLIKKKYNN